MKHGLLLIWASSMLAAQAQEQPQGFQTPVVLIEKNQPRCRQVQLIAATKAQIRYRERAQAMGHFDVRIENLGGMYILKTKDVTEAFELYEGQNYKEARKAFAKIKERFKPIKALDDNPSIIAAYFEMECMRHLEDLESLNKSLSTFLKDALTSETQQRQLELYVLWDALRTKSWDRLDILCREYEDVKLTPDQRAQVGYLHGLALEGLNKPEDALTAYQIALTADAGNSEGLSRKAAIRVLEIHKANPEVQHAISVWGTPDEKKGSRGHRLLLEAGAMAVLYEMSLGGGQPLPSSLKTFVKFAPEVQEIDVEVTETEGDDAEKE